MVAEENDTPPSGESEGQSLLSKISNEIVGAQKQFYGKGPTKAKSYMVDDLLFVVMRGGLLPAEETLVESDKEDVVRSFRQAFENEMTQRLTDKIEALTGRTVVSYQSQILFDPDIAVEIFVFDRPVTEEAREETADSVRDPERGIGEVAGDEVEVSSEDPAGS